MGGDEDWVWKSFLRGLNPIFMDPIEDPKWNSARKAMGQTLTVAQRINLASNASQAGVGFHRLLFGQSRHGIFGLFANGLPLAGVGTQIMDGVKPA